MNRISLLTRYQARLTWLSNLICTGLLIHSIPSVAATLSINIEDQAGPGIIEIQIYNSANAFAAQRDPFKKIRYEVNDTAPFIIEDLPPDEYALLVFLDENDDKKIDKNFIGIPLEPVGFSNRYMPRGPPIFIKAMFTLNKDETRELNIRLKRQLDKSGELGIGPGVIARTSPYRDDNGNVTRLIPAITYIGEQLQIFGPRFQWGLIGSGKFRLALAGQYRFGAYDQDDSPFLQGMGDRDDTILAGLALQVELPEEIDLELSYKLDILDKIGGNIANLRLSRNLQFGNLSFTPKIGFNYLSSDISNYEFGVTDNRATSNRPAYTLGSTTSIEAGIGLYIEFTRNWLLLIDVNIEKFDDQVFASPIVEDNSVINGFATISYVF
jgi:outer membrane protein